MSTMTQNHNTLIEVLQILMPKTNQVSNPDMLEGSVHISTQEALAKNQEELQKEIKINNVMLKQERNKSTARYGGTIKQQNRRYQ